MGVFSSYGTVSSLTGAESVLVAGDVSGNPDGVLRATTAQIAALGGGGDTYTRPPASDFTTYGNTAILTVAEPTFRGSPLTLFLNNTMVNGPDMAGITIPATSTEFIITAKFTPILGLTNFDGSSTVGFGVANAAGQLFTLDFRASGQISQNLWSGPNNVYNTEYGPQSPGSFGPYWRLHYIASGNVLLTFVSFDGASWVPLFRNNGASGPWSGAIVPVSACFYLNADNFLGGLGTSLYHWDIEEGSGLNPFAPVNPL